jgi:hypothetical protein
MGDPSTQPDELRKENEELRRLIADTRFYLSRQILDGTFHNTRVWETISPVLRARLEAVEEPTATDQA